MGYVRKNQKLKVYAIYHDDELRGVGTIYELMETMGLKKKTLRSIICKGQKGLMPHTQAFELEDDEDEQI